MCWRVPYSRQAHSRSVSYSQCPIDRKWTAVADSLLNSLLKLSFSDPSNERLLCSSFVSRVAQKETIREL